MKHQLISIEQIEFINLRAVQYAFLSDVEKENLKSVM